LTQPPEWDPSGLTDLSEFAIRPLDESEQTAVKDAAERLVDEDARARAKEKIAPLTAKGDKWTGSSDQLRWQSWLGASPPPPADTYTYGLTSYLTKLMCGARWSNGSIATGVGRRAVTQEFRGDVVAVYDGLRSNSCPASTTTLPKVMRDLSSMAEWVRNQ
jgi:hypothetical protein